MVYSKKPVAEYSFVKNILPGPVSVICLYSICVRMSKCMSWLSMKQNMKALSLKTVQFCAIFVFDKLRIVYKSFFSGLGLSSLIKSYFASCSRNDSKNILVLI